MKVNLKLDFIVARITHGMAGATRRSTRRDASVKEEEEENDAVVEKSDEPTDEAMEEDVEEEDEDEDSDSDDIEIELRDDIDVVAEHEQAEKEAAEAEEKAKIEAEEAKAKAEAEAAEVAEREEEDAAAAEAAKVASTMTGRRVLDVHPLGSYTFGTKRARGEKDATIANRMLRMKSAYEKEGKRRSVAAICLVNQHRTPHVLLLQVNATSFKLPGGKLRAAEGDIDGLKRKLRNKLQPDSDDGLERHEFDVGDQVATWFRTAFEPQMYPYLPAHITKPKEEHKMFVVQLPEKCYFAVPKNLKLLAVPVFELYGNPGKYGPEIASIPHLLSRYRLNLETAS